MTGRRTLPTGAASRPGLPDGPGDVALRHAPRAHGNRAGLDVGKVGAALGHRDRLERPVAVPGDRYLQLAGGGSDRLGGVPVASVGGRLGRLVVTGVAQVGVELGPEHRLDRGAEYLPQGLLGLVGGLGAELLRDRPGDLVPPAAAGPPRHTCLRSSGSGSRVARLIQSFLQTPIGICEDEKTHEMGSTFSTGRVASPVIQQNSCWQMLAKPYTGHIPARIPNS